MIKKYKKVTKYVSLTLDKIIIIMLLPFLFLSPKTFSCRKKCRSSAHILSVKEDKTSFKYNLVQTEDKMKKIMSKRGQNAKIDE